MVLETMPEVDMEQQKDLGEVSGEDETDPQKRLLILKAEAGRLGDQIIDQSRHVRGIREMLGTKPDVKGKLRAANQELSRLQGRLYNEVNPEIEKLQRDIQEEE